MNNLEDLSSTNSNMSHYTSTFRKEKSIRKREVLLSRISVYIVVLMVSCHTVRIVPTIWEIVQTLSTDTEVGDMEVEHFKSFVCRNSTGLPGWTW